MIRPPALTSPVDVTGCKEMTRAYQDQMHFPSIPPTGPPPETILARTTVATLTEEILEDREPYCSDEPERLGRIIPGGPVDITVTFYWKKKVLGVTPTRRSSVKNNLWRFCPRMARIWWRKRGA